ncbi:MAG TPA: VOC family protein [Candidatus Limnocylindria bacterium]|jgi:catechol 2,3-dioxygenase-like lactoylglutathione lyase family enzyme|nr:VOC family protein [Candidatus Limnocylindria bacterium]
MALNIKKLDSVSIRVRDLDKSTKFYMDVLGLPEIWRMDDMDMRGYGMGDNSATINIEKGAPSMQLIVQVDRVDDARKALEAKGVPFNGPTQTIPNIGKAAGLKDPDGNEILLMDYTIEHGEA